MSIPCDDFDDLDDFDDYDDDMDGDMEFDDDYESDDMCMNDDRMDDHPECFARGDMDDDSYDQPYSPGQFIGRGLDPDIDANIGAMGAFAASVIGANALHRHFSDRDNAVPPHHLNTPSRHTSNPQEHAGIPSRHAKTPQQHVNIPPRYVNIPGEPVHTPRVQNVHPVKESSIRNHDPEPEKPRFTTLKYIFTVIVATLLILLLIYIITV